MAENFKPMAIHELYVMTFHIPSYQRGYRWERRQVRALLDDLRNFLETKPGDNDAYWLQPIVVKPLDNTNEYELVDGQQRLTTIYLLLHYLAQKEEYDTFDKYELLIDKREKQNSYLQQSDFSHPVEGWEKNIDTFYMQRAYETISDWFEEQKKKGKNRLRGSILDMFMLRDGPKVKVIWYQLSGNDEIAAFDRLNHARIPLTGTELVKSLMLGVNKDTNDNEASRRAHAWDRMEKALQQPEFWSMLTTTPVDEVISHIHMILDIVADDINSLNEERLSRAKHGELFNYIVIDEYLQDGHKTEDVWKLIEDTFNKVRNWYDNRTWYHLIGLGQRIEPKEFTVSTLRKLEKNKSKKEFTLELKKKIARRLKRIDHRDNNSQGNIHPLETEKLNYHDNPTDLRHMLLTANVITIEEEMNYRFPFNLYDNKKLTSLEHIHPQNIAEMQQLSPSNLKEYVNIRIAITGFKLDSDKKSCLEKVWDDQEWMVKEKIDDNSEQWQKIEPIIGEIDKEFDRLAEMSQDTEGIGKMSGRVMHSIANMALVSKELNSSLSNNYLSAKRKILVGSDEYAILPCTERVFSKYYTARSHDSVDNMQFWLHKDRQHYLAALKAIYNDFIKTLDDGNQN